MSITMLEYRVVRNNVDRGGDNFGTSDVRRSFEIVPAGQSKIRQDWTIICDRIWENVHSSHIRFSSFGDP